MIAYPIGKSLYLNITNRCTNNCRFCVRKLSPGVAGYDLQLDEEPSVEEIIDAVGDTSAYDEVVFCGYGEPLLRLDAVKEISRWIKDRGTPVRVNTNGLANLFHGRNIVPELAGLVDAISVSLNAENPDQYAAICSPVYGKDSYPAVVEFIKECKNHIPWVQVSVVDVPEVDLDRCRAAARELGVNFLVRHYNPKKY